MQIKIKVVKDANVPDQNRQSVSVETHGRKNDTFVVMKATDVIEGSEEMTYDVPVGGRLVITTPDKEREVVIDTEQNAAIRPSAQTNDANRADRPNEAPQPAPRNLMQQPPQRTITQPQTAKPWTPPNQQNQQPKVQTGQSAPQPGATRTSPPPADATANTARPTTAPMEVKKPEDGTLDSRDKDNDKK